MAYRITRTTKDGSIEAHEADCIYDFNDMLPQPFPEPPNRDWHLLDDLIQTVLECLGWDVAETA